MPADETGGEEGWEHVYALKRVTETKRVMDSRKDREIWGWPEPIGADWNHWFRPNSWDRG